MHVLTPRSYPLYGKRTVYRHSGFEVRRYPDTVPLSLGIQNANGRLYSSFAGMGVLSHHTPRSYAVEDYQPGVVQASAAVPRRDHACPLRSHPTPGVFILRGYYTSKHLAGNTEPASWSSGSLLRWGRQRARLA